MSASDVCIQVQTCPSTCLNLSNSLFTVLSGYVVFFFFACLWLGICVEVELDRMTILPPAPPPLSVFFSLPTILSFNTSDSYLKSTRA